MKQNILKWIPAFQAMAAVESEEITGKAEISGAGLLVVVAAIALCIVVIVVVNGRSKRK